MKESKLCKILQTASDPSPAIDTYIIAEMANAHQGESAIAHAIIEAFAACGADAIKFQLYTAAELMVRSHSAYARFRQREWPFSTWQEVTEHAIRQGFEIGIDILGLESLDLADRLAISFFKIHSSDLSNCRLLQEVVKRAKPILLSAGGATVSAFRVFSEAGSGIMLPPMTDPETAEIVRGLHAAAPDLLARVIRNAWERAGAIR